MMLRAVPLIIAKEPWQEELCSVPDHVTHPPPLFLALQDLAEQKDELLKKVATLKKELQDWRSKLDGQVKSYRTVSIRCLHVHPCHVETRKRVLAPA